MAVTVPVAVAVVVTPVVITLMHFPLCDGRRIAVDPAAVGMIHADLRSGRNGAQVVVVVVVDVVGDVIPARITSVRDSSRRDRM